MKFDKLFLLLSGFAPLLASLAGEEQGFWSLPLAMCICAIAVVFNVRAGVQGRFLSSFATLPAILRWMVPAAVAVLALSPAYITALAYLDFCHGCSTAERWLLDIAAYVLMGITMAINAFPLSARVAAMENLEDRDTQH